MRVDPLVLKDRDKIIQALQARTGEEPKHNKVRCPFHAENSPSLHIYSDHWHCFGCGRGGDYADLLGYFRFGGGYTGEGSQLFEVLDMIAGLGVTPLSDEEREQRARRKAQEDAQRATARDALYLITQEARGQLSEEHLEICRGWGISEKWARGAGLGYDGERITIPAVFRGVIYSVKRRRMPWQGDEVGPKYLSAKGSAWALYNADLLLKAPRQVIICEDEKSALALCSQGAWAIASTGGAGFWGAQKAGEWSKWLGSVQELVFWRDSDDPGLKCALDFRRLFPRAGIVDTGDYKDASDYIAAGHDWRDVVHGATS